VSAIRTPANSTACASPFGGDRAEHRIAVFAILHADPSVRRRNEGSPADDRAGRARPELRFRNPRAAMMRALTIVAAVALIAAIALALATESTTLKAIAIAIGGCACVLAVSIAFYAVGRSEDEQRARDKRGS